MAVKIQAEFAAMSLCESVSAAVVCSIATAILQNVQITRLAKAQAIHVGQATRKQKPFLWTAAPSHVF